MISQDKRRGRKAGQDQDFAKWLSENIRPTVDEESTLRADLEWAHASSEIKAPLRWRNRRRSGRRAVVQQVASAPLKKQNDKPVPSERKLALAAIDRAVKALGPRLSALRAKDRDREINAWLKIEGVLSPIDGEKEIFVSTRSVRRYFVAVAE
jgi:hypothetical protein